MVLALSSKSLALLLLKNVSIGLKKPKERYRNLDTGLQSCEFLFYINSIEILIEQVYLH